MKSREETEKEVERALASFASAPRIEPSPYFAPKIMARIREERAEASAPVSLFGSLFSLQPALLMIFIVANIVTIARSNDLAERRTRADAIFALASDYSLLDRKPPEEKF